MLFGGLDIETTGLKQADGHRIVEIAICIRKENGDKVGKFVSRVNPERSIDPKAQEVHGIAFEDLVDSPTWDKVAPRVSGILAKVDYLVTHNGEGFDLPFVIGELMRAGESVPPIRSVDTMIQGRWATPDGSIPKLGVLAWAAGVPYDPSKAHGAEYDVDVMLDSFFKFWPRGFFKLPGSFYELPKPKERK